MLLNQQSCRTTSWKKKLPIILKKKFTKCIQQIFLTEIYRSKFQNRSTKSPRLINKDEDKGLLLSPSKSSIYKYNNQN